MAAVTVLLVHVPVGFEEAYPLALASLASPLLQAGHRVEGIDVARVGLRGLQERLQRGDITVVGVSVWSPAVVEVRAVAHLVRASVSRPALVLGGPHATIAPTDIPADAVVLGEGELAFCELVDALAAKRPLSDVPGLHLPDGPTSRREPAALADIPLPDRSVFAVSDYHRDHLPMGGTYASAVTSRGCLYRCSFCSAPALWGRGHRFRPAEQVIDEWSRLQRDHGVTAIMVEDDLFTQRRARVLELSEALIAAGLNQTWELLNGIRPDTLDAELLAAMARAGLTRLAVSIECANPTSLRAMGRTPDLQRVRSVVAAARKNGIGVTGYFMVGLPGETRSDRAKTFAFASELRLDMAHFSVASAWPGTAWTTEQLTQVPSVERSAMYARWYLHPARAFRAARMLGVTVAELPAMLGRLGRWMGAPLEARRVAL